MSEILYANIALDIEARELRDRLFAYEIPKHLNGNVFVGSQVLVPFGRQNSIGGYVVSVTENRPAEVKRMRSIEEVVDAQPLFDKDYIEFLNWLALTTCSNLSDVIQAALPSFLAPRLKRKVRLTEKGVEKFNTSQAPKSPLIRSLLTRSRSKTKSNALALSTFKRMMLRHEGIDQKVFYKQLNNLKQEELLEVFADSDKAIQPKTVVKVTLGKATAQTERQKEIIKSINFANGSILLKDLLQQAKTTRNTIKKMHSEGILNVQKLEELRDPLPGLTLSSSQQKNADEISLTNDQHHCLSILEKELETCLNDSSISKDPVEPWLLYGVTGSGKTEVYLRLIEKTLKANKSALLLVPEISLTPQLATQLVRRFSSQVAIWHSGISPQERLDTWKRLKAGSAKILLGARSAVLADIKDLGLIILDEEHDSSYKQTSPAPRYNAKAVASEKARRHGALLVFGSATPCLVTYKTANEKEKVLELPERVHKQKLPDVEIVDMRSELRSGNKSIFSNQLSKKIEERLENKEQIILLMNRRGYASHVFCRACGFVAKCKNCSVSLTFHRNSNRAASSLAITGSSGSEGPRGYLACHHCGINKNLTHKCPECKSPFLKEYGLGTQKVEESILEKFPNAKSVRLDSDITQKKGAFKKVLDVFSGGDADILIGTQMVAKGLDVPNVTLVGVLAADTALNMPDYRSLERGFQLLAQVAGRAGRGYKPGEVIFQTYNPEIEVFNWAKTHDYKSFSSYELQNRQQFLYPPFSRLIRMIVVSDDLEAVESECLRLANEIKSQFCTDKKPDSFQVLGPAACIIDRIRGKWRHHILIKVIDNEEKMTEMLAFLRMRKSKENVRTLVDVDSLDLL